jgi:PAS domain S-box-containing protein
MLQALQPILQTALDAVVAMRSDGTVAAWNHLAERIFGWREDQVIGRPLVDLIIPAQHREAHCAGLARYLRTGEAKILDRRIEIFAADSTGREFPVELSITTMRYDSEVLFVGFLRDITARREAEARLRRQAREAQLLFDVTRLATVTHSFEDALRACLEAICKLTSWPLGHALLLVGEELVSTSVWHDETGDAAAALRSATEQIRFTAGVGLPGMVLETEQPIWIADADVDPHFPRKGLGLGAAFAFPIMSEDRIIAVLEFFAYDKARPDADLMLVVRTLGEQVGRVLERKRTEEHQELLIGELNHRVKNMLTIVQSLAAQTFKGAAPSARQAFDSRLAALAASHDMLTAKNWESASIREIIGKAARGCGAERERVRLDGPDLRLDPKTALSLSLALHELCTNAVKYGAFSNDSGIISISWSTLGTPGAGFRLVWEEHGGPPVSPPQTRGFGSRVIERALAAELGGKAWLEFPPAGVRCILEAPLSGGAS